MPSTQEMKVQMKNGLSRVRANIGQKTKAALQTQILGYFCRGRIDFCQQRTILWRQIGHRSDMTLRNQQNMVGSLRIEILKGHHIIIFVHNRARYLARHDFTKYAILHTGFFYLFTGLH